MPPSTAVKLVAVGPELPELLGEPRPARLETRFEPGQLVAAVAVGFGPAQQRRPVRQSPGAPRQPGRADPDRGHGQNGQDRGRGGADLARGHDAAQQEPGREQAGPAQGQSPEQG